jgi:phospholipid/cholesterol/gamma-HCH transport system substrate-binding protein
MTTSRQDGEALLGAAILVLGAMALGLVYGRDVHTSAHTGGYLVSAKFNHAEGISVGSDIRLSGVVVGKVTETNLAPDFRAVTYLRIRDGVQLPTDTSASIQSDGLLGAKYIEIKVGGEDDILKPGGEITFTQDSLTFDRLMDLILTQARTRRGYVGKELPRVL